MQQSFLPQYGIGQFAPYCIKTDANGILKAFQFFLPQLMEHGLDRLVNSQTKIKQQMIYKVYTIGSTQTISIPCESILVDQGIRNVASHVMLYRHSSHHSQYSFFIMLHRPIERRLFRKQIIKLENYLFKDYKPVSTPIIVGQLSVSSIIDRLSCACGYNIANKLIDIHPLSNTPILDGALISAEGVKFNILKFGERCLIQFSNLCVVSNDPALISVRASYQHEQGIYTARLADHRDLIHKIWQEAVSLCTQMTDGGQSFITQLQVASLYSAWQSQILDAFTRFVLQGTTGIIVQPHPVRALLAQSNILLEQDAFDLSLYQFMHSGLNISMLAKYIAKNFLQYDRYHTSDKGSICLSGAAGSGKTTLSSTIARFFNGFLLQDNGKGVTEFQNKDMIHKSFIRCEELPITRMTTSDWKMVADLVQTIKIRVKNNPDVEIKKFVPVLVTSNSDPYDSLYSHLSHSSSTEQEKALYCHSNIEAVARRWVFIRFIDSWRNAHPDVADSDLDIKMMYINTHQSEQLMVTLLGMSLIFGEYALVDIDEIIDLYAHVLLSFAHTIFGQTVLKNYHAFIKMISDAEAIYNSDDIYMCSKIQYEQHIAFTQMMRNHVYEVACLMEDSQPAQAILSSQSTPVYITCAKLLQNADFKEAQKSQARQLLGDFLHVMEGTSRSSSCLYGKLLSRLDMTLYCAEYTIRQLNDSQAASLQNSFNDVFSIQGCAHDNSIDYNQQCIAMQQQHDTSFMDNLRRDVSLDQSFGALSLDDEDQRFDDIIF